VEVDEEKDASGNVINKTAVTGVAGGFGHECRELFIPRRPFDTQVGIDQYALELMMLGHYLTPFDGGAFARRLTTPGVDFHAENAKLIGQPRKPGKTTMYMTLYGSGPEGIGIAIWDSMGKGTDDVDDWCEAPGVKNWINWQKREQGDMFTMPSRQRRAYYGKGYHAKQGLLNGIVGLKDFIDAVKEAAERNGYVKLIDGRRVGVRKSFAALNTLLQGSGSVACKVWIIQHRHRLEQMGLHALTDWALQEWVHDETQWGTLAKNAEAVGEAGRWAATETSNILKLRVELQASPMIGRNWADCH
jgi:DNA polymerase-1